MKQASRLHIPSLLAKCSTKTGGEKSATAAANQYVFHRDLQI